MTFGNLKPIAHKSKFISSKPSEPCVFPLLYQKSPISIAKVSSEKLIRTKMNFFRCYSKSPRNTRKELERLDTPRFLEVREEFNDISLEPA